MFSATLVLHLTGKIRIKCLRLSGRVYVEGFQRFSPAAEALHNYEFTRERMRGPTVLKLTRWRAVQFPRLWTRNETRRTKTGGINRDRDGAGPCRACGGTRRGWRRP